MTRFRILIFLCCLSALFAARPISAETNGSPAIPEQLVVSNFDELGLHEGLIYWSHRCDIIGRSPSADESKLFRKGVTGGLPLNLATEENCRTFKFIQTEDEGVYYYNGTANSIEFIPIDLSTPAQTIASVTGQGKGLLVDDTYVYYASLTNGIYRVAKSGGTAELFINTALGVDDMIQTSTTIIWSDSAGVWSVAKSCTAPCTGTQLSTSHGRDLIKARSDLPITISDVYFVEQFGSTQRIRRYNCESFNGCTTSTFYNAPVGNVIGELEKVSISTGLFSTTYYLSFTERNPGANEGRLFRKQLGSGSLVAEELYNGSGGIKAPLVSDSTYYYFGENVLGTDRIFRFPIDSEPIVRDFSAENLEVTQAIQNLANDVPLVANKPTYVRFYATQTAGPRAGSVEAQLVGSNNGNALPGSPLQPINGTQILTNGLINDRSNADHGWLFLLPNSWTHADTIALRGVINPRGSYADSNIANDDSDAIPVTFDAEPNACVSFSPIETHTPLPKIGDPNFWETIDLATRLWPIDEMELHWAGEPIRELQFCSSFGFPVPCFGPYEMAEGNSIFNFPSDSTRAIGKVMLRQIGFRVAALYPFNGVCEFGAAVHSVGMVHPLADTNDSGLGNYYINGSWVQFTSHTETGPAENMPSWTFPRSGSTLVHEMTHNFNRRHVNCGGPDDIDSGYDYAPCSIGDNGNANHFGFDGATLAPIAPDTATDYMSYGTRRWVSDYTYRAVKGTFGGPIRSAQTSMSGLSDIVTISGFVDVANPLGSLNYAYTMPTASLSSAAVSVYEEYQTPAYDSARGSGFHLRFKDGNGVVQSDQALVIESPANGENEDDVIPFFLTMAAPSAAIATIELLDGETVLDTISAGLGQPIVAIVSPSTGDVFNSTFTIEWDASDPDAGDVLFYNIDYSRDSGTSWVPLVTGHAGVPNETVSLPLQNPYSTPGTIGEKAQIRVTASDGYNTTIAYSDLFSVTDRAPIADIISPAADAWIEADAVVQLRGTALDAEDGMLSAFDWSVDGNAVGIGNELLVSGLAPGVHTATMTISDSVGSAVTVNRTFEIAPIDLLVRSQTPSLNGNCDDSAYDGAQTMQLPAYPSGAQATVKLTRKADAWYVCFSGLIDGSDLLSGRAGIYIDLGADGDNTPQSGDLAFFVDEAGTPSALVGDNGSYVVGSVSGLSTWIAGNASLFSAELRIDNSALGTLPADAGISVGHYFVDFASFYYQWPHAANPDSPATYAYTLLDTPPAFTGMLPTAALAGQSSVPVVISGTQFEATSQVLWNGTAIPTTFVSATELSVTLGAGQLATADIAQVTVVDNAFADASVAARAFRVNNPLPVLTTASPDTLEQATADVVALVGSDFVAGSQVFLDGEALPTTVVSETELEVMVSAENTSRERISDLVVVNPEPGGGGSSIVPITVENSTPTAVSFAQPQNAAPVSTLALLATILLTIAAYFVSRRSSDEA